MRISVVVFPGSSGADDAAYVYRELLGQDVQLIWHQEEDLKKPDVLILPGGAAFGDYLRPGALVQGSPILGPIRKFARDGGPTLGIGNGFQILCEMGILPGVLLQNTTLHFMSRNVYLSVQNNKTPFTKGYELEDIITLPMACTYGRYFADKRAIRDMEENGEVVFRFCDREGDIDEDNPFNDSLNSIAGIASRHMNVLGMICHPERACEKVMGSEEGLKLLSAVLK
ncbi:MAG: phosphoribosylformylglycinamidine synthase subunit PurQ [Bdellovibrionota bacterium]